MEKVSHRKIVRKVSKKADADYHVVESLSFKDEKMLLKVDGKDYKFKLKDISHKLLNATTIEREAYKVIASGYGISWPLIDEDLSIDGLIKNYKELH